MDSNGRSPSRSGSSRLNRQPFNSSRTQSSSETRFELVRGMTEMEWWAVIVAVVAFVAIVCWAEAHLAAWIADLIKEGMDNKW